MDRLNFLKFQNKIMKKLLFLLSISLLALHRIAAQTPVVHYDFNGPTANGLHDYGPGTAANGTVFGAPVAMGGFWRFNGTADYVRVPYNSKLDMTNWTISVRCRYTQVPGATQYMLQRGTIYTQDYYHVEAYNFAGGPHFFAQNSMPASPAAGAYPAGMQNLVPNQWYCLTATYDGATLRAYIDGVLQYALPEATGQAYLGTEIMFIGSNLGGNRFFNGDLDDIKMYDYAMTPNDVMEGCANSWITVGNQITSSNVFGTRSNNDVDIRTNNVQRGIITSAGNFGFGTTTPGNRVEVRAGTTGPSGLRLGTLSTVSGTNGNVLSLDPATKDVILVPDAGGSVTGTQGITVVNAGGTSDVQLGYACGNAPISLFTTDREIGIGNNHLYLNAIDMGGMYIGGDHCPVHPVNTRLELDTRSMGPFARNAYTVGQPSSSGLRFTDLTATMPTLPNLRAGVLSLDDEGDVIWVATSGAAHNGLSLNGTTVEFGQVCGSPGSAHLLSDRELPMNDHNLIFRDGNALKPYFNRIGIGTPDPNCTPDAKLEVIRNIEGVDYDPINIAISGKNKDMTSGVAIAVNGETNNPSNQSNVGGNFVASDAQFNNQGVVGVGQSANGMNNFGGWFMACGNGTNTGIYASACNSGGGSLSYAGVFNGDIMVNTTTYASDRRIKQNIQPITNALEILNRVQPKKYEFNRAAYPTLNLPTTKDNYGVIAQELEQVLPSLVKDAPVPDGNKSMLKNETIKTVNYIELIPILIQAVKDQQRQIEDLNNKLKTSADQQSNLREAMAHIDVVIGNGDAAVLEQNVPNPYDAFTSIAFYLPKDVKAASIQFATVEASRSSLLKSLQEARV
jgi:hypothetical protein